MFEDTMRAEIAEIEERAFEMASSVARDPSWRLSYAREASQLGMRLSTILVEIEALDNSEYAKLCFRISEAMQDLIFVEKESFRISNRLARELSRPKDF